MEDRGSPEVRDLEFWKGYGPDQAEDYFTKHQTGLFRRLSMWREEAIARQALALAGNPRVVLDLPCGAGRFWPLLAEKPERRILAADNSADMVRVACEMQPPELVKRVECFRCSAYETGLDDGSVDSVFCIRLLHHIIEPVHRLRMLREFHRITRETVCISLWVDGNYKAYRRVKRGTRRRNGKHCNRYVMKRRTIEAEFVQAGFKIKGHFDFLRFYSMWRVYVLDKG